MSENRAVVVMQVGEVNWDPSLDRFNRRYIVGVINADINLDEYEQIAECCDPHEYTFRKEALEVATEIQKQLKTEYGVVEVSDNGNPINLANKYQYKLDVSQPGTEQPDAEFPVNFTDQDEV